MTDRSRGFSRFPTAPIDVPTTLSGPDPSPDHPGWEPDAGPVEPAGFDRGFAGWALGFAIVGLAVSLFVGWGFVIGIVAIVAGIMALRHPRDSRRVAVWAIVLGGVSILYSAGWLLYAWAVLT
tara:strand:- start:293 stop:661 length:369 start_codon:yes stop_codon:yes gene_type:complete